MTTIEYLDELQKMSGAWLSDLCDGFNSCRRGILWEYEKERQRRGRKFSEAGRGRRLLRIIYGKPDIKGICIGHRCCRII